VAHFCFVWAWLERAMKWDNTKAIESLSFTCGHCGKIVASNQGYASSDLHRIRVCPHCTKPSFFGPNNSSQIPSVAPGVEVGQLPKDIESLYREARNCVAISSYTAAVLTCRKLLMNIGVAEGADPGKKFVSYVEHLATKGYVPPNCRGWVDHIRTKGNEANHEIVLMNKADAEELISFVEMLLKFIYEFPNRVPKPKT
jgi:hypothetical protein